VGHLASVAPGWCPVQAMCLEGPPHSLGVGGIGWPYPSAPWTSGYRKQLGHGRIQPQVLVRT
jgi:hypothetical protein